MSRPETFVVNEEMERVALANLGGRNRRMDHVVMESAVALEDSDLDETELEDNSVVTESGECELCHRSDLELTRHHLIPRSRHRKARSKRQFTREAMRSRIAHLCRD